MNKNQKLPLKTRLEFLIQDILWPFHDVFQTIAIMVKNRDKTGLLALFSVLLSLFAMYRSIRNCF